MSVMFERMVAKFNDVVLNIWCLGAQHENAKIRARARQEVERLELSATQQKNPSMEDILSYKSETLVDFVYDVASRDDHCRKIELQQICKDLTNTLLRGDVDGHAAAHRRFMDAVKVEETTPSPGELLKRLRNLQVYWGLMSRDPDNRDSPEVQKAVECCCADVRELIAEFDND